MAATGLPEATKLGDEGHRVGVHPEGVGVGDAAGQHQGVVVVDLGVAHRHVDLLGVGLVEVLEHLHLARLGAQQLRGVSGVGHRRPGLDQFGLLDAFGGDQERDLLCLSHSPT